MVLPEADWKNQADRALDRVILLVAGGLVGIYLLLWWSNGGLDHIGLVAVLATWVSVYFTSFWQPVLYLLVAGILLGFTLLWFVDGSWERPLLLAAIVLNVLFVGLAIRLFFSEEPGVPPDERGGV